MAKQMGGSGSGGWARGMQSVLAPIAVGVAERFFTSSSTASSSALPQGLFQDLLSSDDEFLNIYK